MKPSRLTKVLGLSIGERSLLAAEISTGESRPEVKQLAEFVYPEGISPQTPEQLGAALGTFLRDNKFTAKSAVFGLPARWLVVKSKEVPPADSATLANMLRLQAEGEFSSELKDLVYDYAADTTAGQPRSVLLIATPKKYVDAVNQISDAARISPVMLTSSAVALGLVTGRAVDLKNPLVLLVSPAGAELTAQSGGVSNAIRHLRGPGPDRPFVGELRRAITGMPPAVNGSAVNGARRELVLWNAAGSSELNTDTLGETLGVPIRTGDLPILGVDASTAASNGEGRKYAAAVSLALLAVGEKSQAVDFLHSRLAPPIEPRIPEWVKVSVLSAVALTMLVVWAYTHLQTQKALRDKQKKLNDDSAAQVQVARDFNAKVDFVQAWHITNPRYEACMADLTKAVPLDGQTYATNLTISEVPPPPPDSSLPAGSMSLPAAQTRNLLVRLEGKTTDQNRALDMQKSLQKYPLLFKDVKPGEAHNGSGARGGNEVTFSITFTYVPPKAVITTTGTPAPKPGTETAAVKK